MKSKDDLITRFGAFVSAKTGGCYPKEKQSDLRRAAAEAAQALQFDSPETLMSAFLAQKTTADQWDMLLGRLTIGESYFFREPRLFAYLRECLLPQMVRQQSSLSKASKKLKIWSAGCASGQEPYSIAILIDTLIGFNHVDIELVASDINPLFIREAQEGIYRAWSFRGMDQQTQGAYFQPLTGDRFRLRSEIRERVQFLRINLVDATDITQHIASHTVDLILCRNVLMYLTIRFRQKAINNLVNALTWGGYLVTSPSETGSFFHSELNMLKSKELTYFQKTASQKRAAFAQEPVKKRWRVTQAHKSRPKPRQKEETQRAAVSTCGKAVEISRLTQTFKSELPSGMNRYSDRNNVNPDKVSLAKQYAVKAEKEAGRGRYQTALAFGRQAADLDKFNPAHRYLIAGILWEAGDLQAAQSAIKEALYLDPTFILAHISLGRLAALAGDNHKAHKSFANAVKLLKKQAPETVIADSGGMTASEILRSLRKSNI